MRANRRQHLTQLPLGDLQFVVLLKVEPATSVGTEVTGQPQRRVGRDATSTIGDLVDARRGDPQGDRQRVGGQTERDHVVLAKNFAGMDGGEFLGHSGMPVGKGYDHDTPLIDHR